MESSRSKHYDLYILYKLGSGGLPDNSPEREEKYYEETKAAFFSADRRACGRKHTAVSSRCDGSYIENQDMLRYSGIFRDVYMTAKEQTEIRDFTVTTDLDENYENAELKAEVDLRSFSGEDKDGYTVKGYLYDAEGKLVTEEPLTGTADFADGTETTVTLSGQIMNPAKWTAEHPNLYTLVLVLEKDGQQTEITSSRVGFREVEITDAGTNDARLRVNGQIVTIYGVNRHENDPDTGWYLTEEDMRKEGKGMLKRRKTGRSTCLSGIRTMRV